MCHSAQKQACCKVKKNAHRQSDVDNLGEAPQSDSYNGEADVGPQYPQAGNGGKVLEEGLLPHRKAGIKNDRRKKEPAKLPMQTRLLVV